MVGDMELFQSMMTKTLLYAGERPNTGVVSELFSTHPDNARRLSLAREFFASQEFARGREKLRRRRELATAPRCKSCGHPALKGATFCGSCGRVL